MENSGLSRRQKLVIAVLIVTVVTVLVALTSLVRSNDATSPVPTAAAFPVAQSSATPQVVRTPTADSAHDAQPTSSAAKVVDEVEVARVLQSYSAAVGKIRELPKQQEIPLNFVEAQELAAFIRALRIDPARREFVRGQQHILAALDLAPREDEAFPTTVQTRSKNVIALYDSQQQQIFIGPAGLAVEDVDISLVHQFAHAYIDQHFDLENSTDLEANGDSIRAWDALVEGDAMLVLGQYHLGLAGADDLEQLARHMVEAELTDYEDYRISRATEELLLFPYREGARFASALLEAGWWPAINAAYLDAPTSSEQILHPEKYIGKPRDVPQEVGLPDLTDDLSEDWHVVAQDVLGELVLRTHLDYFLPSTLDAIAAAEGWDGDLANVWNDQDGRELLVMRSVWDSISDAQEFATAYASLVEIRLSNPRRVSRSIIPRGGRWWRGDEGDAFLLWEDDTVLVIWAPDTEEMERALSAFVFGED